MQAKSPPPLLLRAQLLLLLVSCELLLLPLFLLLLLPFLFLLLPFLSASFSSSLLSGLSSRSSFPCPLWLPLLLLLLGVLGLLLLLFLLHRRVISVDLILSFFLQFLLLRFAASPSLQWISLLLLSWGREGE